MLSKLLKEKIELAFGQQVKYPRDCDALAADIATKTNQRISGSTLRRLFGFIAGTSEPRSFTLDVIAEYVGYTCFEQLIESFKDKPEKDDSVIEEVISSTLQLGDIIRILFDQSNDISIEFMGESRFKVNESSCNALQKNDIITISKVKLHQPLFIEKQTRNVISLGANVYARVSGVKSIQIC